MPLIEGLGDEVTLVMAALLMCVLVTLAWFSTHTADLPALREVGITVIERTQIRRRIIAQPAGDQDRPPDTQNLVGLVEFVSRQANGASEDGDEDVDAGVRSSEEARGSVGDSGGPMAPSAPVPSDTSTDGGDSASTSTSNVLPHTTVSPQLEGTPTENTHHSSEPQNVTKPNHSEGVSKSEDCSKDRAGNQVAGAVGDTETSSEIPTPVQPLEYPVEEEVRRRRVKFFQNSSSSAPLQGSCNSVSAASGPEGNAVKGFSNSNTSKPLSAASSTQSSNDSQSKPSNTSSTDSPSVMPPQPQPQPQSSSTSITTETGPDAHNVQQPSQRIRVKLKYMNETQRLVYTSPLDTIGNFRRTHFQQELQEGDKWVRFIFNGQDLRDDEATLQAYQVGDNCTMHCLITNKRRTPTGQAGSAGGAGSPHGSDDDESESVMGALMYPLFTLILAVVWYFRLTYRQYFSPMSTVCLIGISFLLGLGYFSSLRTTAAATTGNQQQPSSPGTEQRTNHAHSD